MTHVCISLYFYLFQQVEAIYQSEKWQTIIPMTELKPGYESSRMHYFEVDCDQNFTHLRLNIFPDGGIARLRTYGIMQTPSIDKLLSYPMQNGDILVDLVAMENGAVCQGLSDAHYGHPRNLIKKGKLRCFQLHI